jgi:hypothetical protein
VNVTPNVPLLKETYDAPMEIVPKMEWQEPVGSNFPARAITIVVDKNLWEGGPMKLVPVKKPL